MHRVLITCLNTKVTVFANVISRSKKIIKVKIDKIDFLLTLTLDESEIYRFSYKGLHFVSSGDDYYEEMNYAVYEERMCA